MYVSYEEGFSDYDGGLDGLSSWLKKKSTKRGLIIGGALVALAGAGYYASTRSEAGNVLGAQALTQQQKGALILKKAQLDLKKGPSLWSKTMNWFKKRNVSGSIAKAVTKQIVQGKRSMPSSMAKELAPVASSGGIGMGTLAIGGAAVIGAVVMAKD